MSQTVHQMEGFTLRLKAMQAARALFRSGSLVVEGAVRTLDEIYLPLEGGGYAIRLRGTQQQENADMARNASTAKPTQAATKPPKAAAAAPAPIKPPAPDKTAPTPPKAAAAAPAPVAKVAAADGTFTKRASDSGRTTEQILGNRAMVDLLRERGPQGATAAELREASGFATVPPASWFTILADRNGFALSNGTNTSGGRTFIATFPGG